MTNFAKLARTPEHEPFEREHNLVGRPRQVTPINVEGLTPRELELCMSHPAVHGEVRRCALLQHAAFALRADGDITRATRLEAKLQRVYETLPKHLRW